MTPGQCAREAVYAAVTCDLHGNHDMTSRIIGEYQDPEQLASHAIGLASALIERAALLAGIDPRELWAQSVTEIVAAAQS